ncbi:hypothetical protein ES706_04624 [subsurface metagenome]
MRNMIAKQRAHSVVSLFSGCGGLDLGFMWAGYNIIWANDNSPEAVKTYKENLGNHILLGNIKELDLDQVPDCEIIIGGPPCQSFSLVGKRDPKDPRGNLIWNFYEIVKVKRPVIFLMENVTGLKTAKDSRGVNVLSELLRLFNDLGYSVNYFILNAADYGVPQRRRRIFIVGNRDGQQMPLPEPTHTHDLSRQPLIGQRQPWITCRDALDDLSTPYTDSDIGHYEKAPDCTYQQLMRAKNGSTVRNHQMPYMSETDLKIIRAVPIGGNYMDVPDDIATQRIMNFKKTGGRTTTYGRMDPSKPAYTLNTHFSRPNVGCNIHYREDRLITIREGMRIQSFPDRFVVYSTSKRGTYEQVGNAVPPLLAQAVARHLLPFLKDRNGTNRESNTSYAYTRKGI